ncbi:MAG: hypothetical protein ACR2IT_13145 [Pirellulales bacterium]
MPPGSFVIRKHRIVWREHARASSHWPFMVVATCLLVLVAAGCGRDADIRLGDIRTYTIPKDAEPAPLPSAAPEARPADGPRVQYEVPEGWTDGGGSGMRLATLLIGDPADKREVTIIPASGTLASNVERWLGQLDPESTADARRKAAAAAIEAGEPVDVAGRSATVVLLRTSVVGNGADDAANGSEAILGAMIPVDDSSALFVKFKGDAAVAIRERERFIRFVSSILLDR